MKDVVVDKGTMTRLLRIKHRKGVIESPVRAFNASSGERGFFSGLGVAGGIYEIYINLRVDKLLRIKRDRKLEEEFAYRINRRVKLAGEKDLIVVIPNIEMKLDSVGAGENLGEYIAKLVNVPGADVVSTLSFYRVNEDLALKIFRGFLKTIVAISNGDIALLVPYVSEEKREKFIEIYFNYAERFDNLLYNFIFADYNGSNPVGKFPYHNSLVSLTRGLEEAMGEPVLLYGVNIKYSRVSQKYDSLPARDLASPYLGVDVLGPNHRRPVLPEEIAYKMDPLDSKIINLYDYTYVSLRNASTVKGDQFGLMRSRVNDILKYKGDLRKLELHVKLFNAESILMEMQNIKAIIKERYQVRDYLRGKNGLVQDKRFLRALNSLASKFGTGKLTEFL